MLLFLFVNRDKNNTLVDLNTITFVAVHELSHLMNDEYGHEQKFWDLMKFILSEIIPEGFYNYQDFHNNPVNYCGTKITDTPYKL